MKNRPLVSVIIPCYNLARYLEEAVQSVAAQTWRNLECIIVNDGSKDDTSRIAQQIITAYPERKIILIEKANGGTSEARNSGIKISQGKYLLPLDADDKIHPAMIQNLVTVLEADPSIAIAYSDALLFGMENRVINTRDFDREVLLLNNILCYCSLYRREVWEKTKGYNPNMKAGYEDWDYWIACIENGFTAKRLSKPLFFYRIRENSRDTNARSHHDFELKKQIVQNHPHLYREHLRFIKEALLKNNEKNDLAIKILFSPWMGTILLSQKIHIGIDHFKIGRALFECGEYEKSKIWLDKVLERKNLPFYSRYGIASLYKRMNHLETARKIFQDIILCQRIKIKSGAFFHLGEIARLKNKPKEAQHFFKKCLSYCPEHQKAREYLQQY